MTPNVRNRFVIRVLFTCVDSPSNTPLPGMWKGCLSNGKWGYFNPTNTVPYVEPKMSPISLPKTSLSRKGGYLLLVLLRLFFPYSFVLSGLLLLFFSLFPLSRAL